MQGLRITRKPGETFYVIDRENPGHGPMILKNESAHNVTLRIAMPSRYNIVREELLNAKEAQNVESELQN